MGDEMRKKIGLHMSSMDVVTIMSEGNPGALRVLIELLSSGPMGMFDVLSLDDMNMRGPQVWVAYKDFAGEELPKLLGAIKKRDPELVAVVNRHHGPEVAVTNGASWNRSP